MARMIERRAWWIILALTLWAGHLRLRDLDRWWLSPDECIYYDILSNPGAEADASIARNAHPPLHYRFLQALGRITLDFTALRLPSVVAGVLLVPLFFLLGRRLAGVTAGLVAALLIAASPGAVMLSQTLRPYMLELVFLTLAMLGLARYLDERRSAALASYSVALSIALFLHYSAFVVLGGVGLALLFLFCRRRLDRAQVRNLVIANLLPLASVIYLYVTHIGPRLVGSGIHEMVRSRWLPHHFVTSPDSALSSYGGAMGYAFGRDAGVAAAILAVVGICAAIRKSRSLLWLLPTAVLFSALFLSILGLFPFGRSRHSIYLAVVLAPAAGYGVSFLLTRSLRVYRVLGSVSVALFLCAALWSGVVGLDLEARGLLRELSLPREDVEAVDAFLRKNKTAVIADSAGYLVLTTLDRMPDIIKVDAWRLSARREDSEQPNHLRHVLAKLDLDSGRVWVLQGEWAPPLTRELPRSLYSDLVGGERFGLLHLDVAAYRDYLEAR